MAYTQAVIRAVEIFNIKAMRRNYALPIIIDAASACDRNWKKARDVRMVGLDRYKKLEIFFRDLERLIIYSAENQPAGEHCVVMPFSNDLFSDESDRHDLFNYLRMKGYKATGKVTKRPPFVIGWLELKW